MPSIVNQKMLEEMNREFESNPYAFISSFDSLTVAQMSELRGSLSKLSKRSMVVRQSLAKKALANLQFDDAAKFFKEHVLVTIGEKDPQAISKALVAFAKTHEKFSPKGVIFEKKIYDEKFVKSLASLPSRKELLTQVVVRVKSPISGFVMTLSQVLRGVVVALNEIKKQKETSATA